MIDKVFSSPEAAVEDVPSGATVLVGGFSFCGVPENLLRALSQATAFALATASDDVGLAGWGISLLVEAGRVRKMTVGRAVDNPEFERRYGAGEVEVEFVPLGTLVERIRAGGAGIPAFFTPTGYGTIVAGGKEIREFDGRPYLLEHGLVGDYGLVAAWRGDRLGNLTYRGSARNINPTVAVASKVCIAEVEELVEVGELVPECIHTPGIHVQRVVVKPRAKGRGHALSPLPHDDD
jgi:3-oxoacid CoA-transferase subunit A